MLDNQRVEARKYILVRVKMRFFYAHLIRILVYIDKQVSLKYHRAIYLNFTVY